ncbi:MAG: 4Fe-4S binding protein, partial [Chloroflexi bacterium]|nr:4Fe-4S binding protein [Chloroflexota bacterium]
KCNEDGLVHTFDPSWAICNCCADCCVFFVGLKATGDRTLEPSHFVATVDQEMCNACGTCAERCPVDAIEIDSFAAVNSDVCLGCGVCVPTCTTETLRLVRRIPAVMSGSTAG